VQKLITSNNRRGGGGRYVKKNTESRKMAEGTKMEEEEETRGLDNVNLQDASSKRSRIIVRNLVLEGEKGWTATPEFGGDR